MIGGTEMQYLLNVTKYIKSVGNMLVPKNLYCTGANSHQGERYLCANTFHTLVLVVCNFSWYYKGPIRELIAHQAPLLSCFCPERNEKNRE